MHCADEFVLIEKGLGALAGICRVAPNYVNRSLLVEYEPARLDTSRIARHLDKIGFPAQEVESAMESAASSGAKLRTTTLAGGLLLAAAAVVRLVWPNVWVEAWLAILSTLLSGWPVALAGWRAARLRQLDMNFLMTVAAVGAIAICQWYESAIAMFLFSVSLWLEALHAEHPGP